MFKLLKINKASTEIESNENHLKMKLVIEVEKYEQLEDSILEKKNLLVGMNRIDEVKIESIRSFTEIKDIEEKFHLILIPIPTEID